jgi:L-amino acid N-acyltransferase YncA
MINELMKIRPNSFAKVKLDNEASIRLFESCGFRKKYYILEKENADL